MNALIYGFYLFSVSALLYFFYLIAFDTITVYVARHTRYIFGFFHKLGSKVLGTAVAREVL